MVSPYSSPYSSRCVNRFRGWFLAGISLVLISLWGNSSLGNDQTAPPDRLEISLRVTGPKSIAYGRDSEKKHIRENPTKLRRTLVLSRYSIRSDDYRIRVWSKSEKYQPLELPPVRTYRGFCKGHPNERVTAVVYSDGQIQATATTGVRFCWHTPEPVDVSKQVKGKPGTNEGKSHWPGATIQRSKASGPFFKFPLNRSLQRTQLAGDITNICVKNVGNVDDSIAWTEWQTCLADESYVRDLGLSIELTDVIVRKDKFYPGEKSANILGPLRDYWQARESEGNWDYVNGFTATDDGLSYRGGPHSAGPLTHEVGHSFNMAHSIFGVDMQNPICHDRALIHFEDRKLYSSFDEIPKPSGKYPYVVHPYTVPDIAITKPNVAVTIPVLANDWDSNGQLIHLKEFTEKTRAGGTVTLEKIAAKLPQDPTEQLVYTPPQDYIGKDAIAYTVANESGLFRTEVAHIYLIDDEAELAAHWPLDRLGGGKSANLIQKKQVAIASDGVGAVAGKIGKAIQVPPGELVICGDVNILPKKPADFMPGHRNKWAWYPLEKKIGNLFDPLDRDYSAAFWVQVSDTDQRPAQRRQGPKDRKTGDGKPADGSPTHDVIFCKTDEDIVDAVGFRITATDNTVSLTVLPYNGYRSKTGSKTIQHQKKLGSGQWHHVAMVIDRSRNRCSVWLDGEKSDAEIKLGPSSIVFSGRSHLCLRSPDNKATSFDDVRVAYRAFSAEEISKLAAGQ